MQITVSFNRIGKVESVSMMPAEDNILSFSLLNLRRDVIINRLGMFDFKIKQETDTDIVFVRDDN